MPGINGCCRPECPEAPVLTIMHNCLGKDLQMISGCAAHAIAFIYLLFGDELTDHAIDGARDFLASLG